MKFIGLSGFAGCGKDLFFRLFRDLMKSEYGVDCYRYALADALKKKCKREILNIYGVDSLNCPRDQKEVIRGYLINFAAKKRAETQGRFFIDILDKEIQHGKHKFGDVIVITDVRFAEFPKDEVYWLKNQKRGVLAYIQKTNLDDSFQCAPNETEAVNDPKVREEANYIVSWKHGDSEKNLKKEVYNFIDFFIRKSNT